MPQFHEMLKEYQLLYKEQCSSFIKDSHTLWPISAKNGAEEAQNVFNLGWDLETIISNWQNEKTLLPDEYQYELYSQLIIFTIILSVIGVIILLCCCQIFCIPKYKVFMRCCYINVETDTKSTFEKYFLFFGIILLSLMLCTVCGLSYTDKQIESSLLQVKCISLWMIENTIEQQNDQGWQNDWQGILYINKQIKSLSQELTDQSRQDAINQLSQIKTKQLQQQYKIENQYLSDLYEYNFELKLINPNPYSNQQHISSNFIEQIGPSNQLGTVTNLLLEELSSRDQAIFLMKIIKSKSQYINISQIIDNLNQSQSQLNDFSYNIINLLSKLEQTLNTKSWIFDSGVTAYKRFLIITCTTTVILLFSFSLVTWFRFQKMGFLLHISWIALAVLLIIGFIILIFVYYVSLINNNMVCNLAHGVIHDKNVLKRIIKIMKPTKHFIKTKSFFQQVEVCLYQNGDFVSYFDLNQTFQNIIDLDRSIQEFDKLSHSRNVINFYQSVISSYFTNYSLVINTDSDDNPQNVLRNMNNWTDYNIDKSMQILFGGCRVSQDEWEWKDTDCKYYKADLLKLNFYSNPHREFGMAICLIFDSCDEDFAKQRYMEQYKRCKTKNKESISQIVLKYFDQIKLYIDSVNRTFKPILANLTEYEQLLTSLDNEIKQQIVNLTYYGSQLNLIFHKTQNLTNTLNCSYIKQGTIRFKNTFCTTLLNGMFFMYIYLISICTLLSCLGILSVWSAMRCIPKSEQHQVFLEAAIGPMQQRTIQRKSLDVN
ncbi:unnamed protein product [Paramecium octaurelia]|uniref:Uncharacterized protein n=1 Tax=Paramecium octaurelia TaxID=43137 RepID=A0A8S1UBB5_PAROT|nr:unnamed protein product [Paramecium octaurelia]